MPAPGTEHPPATHVHRFCPAVECMDLDPLDRHSGLLYQA